MGIERIRGPESATADHVPPPARYVDPKMNAKPDDDEGKPFDEREDDKSRREKARSEEGNNEGNGDSFGKRDEGKPEVDSSQMQASRFSSEPAKPVVSTHKSAAKTAAKAARKAPSPTKRSKKK